MALTVYLEKASNVFPKVHHLRFLNENMHSKKKT
jgi:hypothetical protein